MNLIFLYSEAMGYTLATIKTIIKIHGATVHLVHWDKKKNTPFQFPDMGEHFFAHKRSETDIDTIKRMIDELSPKAIYCSGRMDKDYLKACFYARKKGITTVSGFDSQWHGTMKNKIQEVFGNMLYRRYFEWAWIAGIYQFEYVRRIGYSKEKIIHGLYSADTEKLTFTANFSKRFLFVGRFVNQKGITTLVKSFLETHEKQENEWELHLIGNGTLGKEIPNHPKIVVNDFMQPEHLFQEMRNGGVFVLPSNHEPWGVVVHEFAAVGYPIICSDAVGSAVQFVKHNYNGFIFPKNDPKTLTKYFLHFINSSEETWREMSTRSKELSKSHNSEIAATQFGILLNN